MNRSIAMKALQVGLAALLAGSAWGASYEAIRIVAPTDDATVHDNSGKLVVVVQVTPPLAAGDRITLLIDGSAVASAAATRFELQGVDRGTHRLEAQVIDADGGIAASSAPVRFQMWRASRFLPGARK
jgi:hypothetical protein